MKIKRVLEIVNPSAVSVGSKGKFGDSCITCPDCRSIQFVDKNKNKDKVNCVSCGNEIEIN